MEDNAKNPLPPETSHPSEQSEQSGVTRRTALKIAGVGAWMGTFAYALSPLESCMGKLSDEFLSKHYKELTDDDKKRLFARYEKEVKKEKGVDIKVSDPQAQQGVKYGYALNLTTCIGCRKCVEACHKENNHDRGSNMSYIRVFEIPEMGIDPSKGTTDYDHPVPVKGRRYFPMQCMHCDNPPCVSVCPTKATWKEKDGIVVIDYDWCIGCRYCAPACPYEARFFNWKTPKVPAKEVNPDQGWLSNRERPAGVMEKCHFCLHRVRRGQLPACLEACPAGSRVFGNLLDPNSEIRWVLKNRRTFVLKAELNTKPSFFYFLAE